MTKVKRKESEKRDGTEEGPGGCGEGNEQDYGIGA